MLASTARWSGTGGYIYICIIKNYVHVDFGRHAREWDNALTRVTEYQNRQ